ncbi:MAG: biotin--protein ligase [Candidatus Micrarchaeota archaeon]|nr:biotin--protein ligase [Candidatus Micrarchaeota archaeon]
MEGFAEQKVPGGKMVSVRLVYGPKIRSVQILGDFFLHPEETLPMIEKALVGTSPRAKKDEIAGKIAKVLAMRNAELIGVTPDAIAETIRMAVKK